MTNKNTIYECVICHNDTILNEKNYNPVLHKPMIVLLKNKCYDCYKNTEDMQNFHAHLFQLYKNIKYKT